ncbi:M81 family metallopeptidase [Rhodospirillaceae bacterium SYSU D60014]|uniref:M81 family metallopeptidase n=1 Tax=Virgifigura deserti TaxID=2268457 RepID=UPI000E662EF7
MARIAVGGFQHETNTFAPSKARFADFERGAGWPGLTAGPALFETVAGINLPVTGFVDAARAAGHDLVPLLWCAATPSAHVEQAAFERIAEALLQRLTEALPVDGVYLDLHGAMVTEHLEDGDGELLRRVRALVGPAVPVVASLDFHANVTAEMVAQVSALVAYRTYPHIDMDATGARAARLLDRLLTDDAAVHKAMRKLLFLIPLPWQCTLIEPMASIYRELEALEEGEVLSLSFAPGFPPADIAECGPSVMAYGRSQQAADQAAETLADMIGRREADFAGRVYSPDEAVRSAQDLVRQGTRPVVLADTQDNPGAGGSSDTVGLLDALVRLGAEGAVVAVLHDPEVAAAAHAVGQGGEITVRLGAKSGLPGHRPFDGTFRVERLGDGSFAATGPFYRGSRMRLGPMALLSVAGVRVIVASVKQQAADQAMFRHLGVEPAEQNILALKSSVHFRADFQPIAGTVLVVAAPGPNPIDHRLLPYRRLRSGVRLMPAEPTHR